MTLILRGKDIKTKHLKFINELNMEAKKCPNGTPHVACLIFNNKIVSIGHSTFKSHITDSVKECLLCAKQIHYTCRTRLYFKIS